MPDNDFDGFPKATSDFLAGLTTDNSKAWFDAHRTDYETYFVTPALAFVAALGPKLQKISPDVQFAPKINGSLFRINRDVRFSKDKTPYKNHLDMWFWHGNRRGWDAPGFWFRMHADRLLIGGGMHRFEKQHQDAYRNAVVADPSGKALEKAIAAVTSAGPYRLGEPTRKSVPRGFDKDHPRAHLLLHDGLTVGMETKLPKVAREAGFVDFCAGHYKAMAPVVKWLLNNVSAGA